MRWLWHRLIVALGGVFDASVRGAEEEFARSRRKRLGYVEPDDGIAFGPRDIACASNEQIDELPEED